eukprot:TRINITY_DN541_c0_g1_i1.p1 TRINITY_DN541_c0_g1~~TRINITY_DN541_c0_g1_i1.p1  ORF type:complete len:161 (-),score=41.53 TRINITY_DN541_c0_g1_i1:145-627(-)
MKSMFAYQCCKILLESGKHKRKEDSTSQLEVIDSKREVEESTQENEGAEGEEGEEGEEENDSSALEALLKSFMRNSVEEFRGQRDDVTEDRHVGMITVKRDEDEVSLHIGHTTPTMAVGYFYEGISHPKTFISRLEEQQNKNFHISSSWFSLQQSPNNPT